MFDILTVYTQISQKRAHLSVDAGKIAHILALHHQTFSLNHQLKAEVDIQE